MAKKQRNLVQEIEAARIHEQMCQNLLRNANVLYERIKPAYEAIDELHKAYRSNWCLTQRQAMRAKRKLAALLKEQKEGGGVDG